MPRLTIEFSDKTSQKLAALAKKEGLSKVDVIRRALALYDYVEEEVQRGHRVAIADKQGQLVREVVMP